MAADVKKIAEELVKLTVLEVNELKKMQDLPFPEFRKE